MNLTQRSHRSPERTTQDRSGPNPYQCGSIDLPLVSVVIPAYNASRYVREALQSVVDQHYAPIEILLVDDGSTDDTVELVRKQFPQVRIISQPNSGVATARNTGLDQAVGDLVCFLDADDGWYPGKLHAQVSHLQTHPETGAVYHTWRVWPPETNGCFQALPDLPPQDPAAIDPEKSGWIYPQLLMDCIVHTSSVMIRRGWLEKVGRFKPDLINGEDYDFWLRLSRLTQIDKLAGVYSFYRGSPGSLTRSVKPINYEYEVISSALAQWGRVAPDGRELPKVKIERRLGKLAFDFAYGHYLSGSPRLARRASLQALRYDPSRLKAVFFYLASLFRKERHEAISSR
ncbi:MAG: glycosyltransferase family 2 protein [Propionivibrio sp.]|nr:glycosyltransferase family 2 protein [Propionivibrio sp.]